MATTRKPQPGRKPRRQKQPATIDLKANPPQEAETVEDIAEAVAGDAAAVANRAIKTPTVGGLANRFAVESSTQGSYVGAERPSNGSATAGRHVAQTAAGES